MIHVALKEAILTDDQRKSASTCIASLYKGVHSLPMKGLWEGGFTRISESVFRFRPCCGIKCAAFRG